jgi:AcrR family transcriptional regulator
MADFTERAIKASFLKLLNEQPLNKISVRMIVEDCGINRNSFYYHYQDIPTLLETIITEYTDNLIRKYPTIASLSECFQVAFQFAMENKRAVTHIYQSVNWDMFEREALRLCEHAVTAYVDSAFDAPMDETDRKILIRFISCELFGMCVSWISRGMDGAAIEELERMLQLCHGMSAVVIQRSQETKNV